MTIFILDSHEPDIPEEDIEDLAATNSANPKTNVSKSDESKPSTSEGQSVARPSSTATSSAKETPKKRQRINPQSSAPQKSTSTNTRDPNQVEQVKKNLSQQPTTTSLAQPIEGSTAQQVETSRGPEHNTKGTLQGESGNRKIQKPQKRYGIIKVIMADHTYIFLFNDKDATENCSDIFEMSWPSTKIFCTSINIKIAEKEDHYFLCAIQLGFRINWSTLYKRIGSKVFDDCTYLQRQIIKENMDNIDDFKLKIQGNLNVCFRNNIPSINITDEIEKETTFKTKQNNQDFASTSKRPRWN